MNSRYHFHIVSDIDLFEVGDLVAKKRVLSLSELQSYVQHPDERLAASLTRYCPSAAELVAWALYDRAIVEADAAGEAWNPLLDRAAWALQSCVADEMQHSPAGHLLPTERARALEEWAATASRDELNAALEHFLSGTARGAIVRRAVNVDSEMVQRWVSEVPLLCLAENVRVAGDPEMAAPLVEWALEEIQEGHFNEDLASEVLVRLLDAGWEMDDNALQILLENAHKVGLVDHEKEEAQLENRCFPAASVLSHPGVRMSPDEWVYLLKEIPLQATFLVSAIVHREDALESALGIILERIESHGRYMYVDWLLDSLATHSGLAVDAALRGRFLKRANLQARLKVVPALSAEEYWTLAEALTRRVPDTVSAWLQAATPEHRMAATPERLLSFLQHESSEVRLRAQSLLPALANV